MLKNLKKTINDPDCRRMAGHSLKIFTKYLAIVEGINFGLYYIANLCDWKEKFPLEDEEKEESND